MSIKEKKGHSVRIQSLYAEKRSSAFPSRSKPQSALMKNQSALLQKHAVGPQERHKCLHQLSDCKHASPNSDLPHIPEWSSLVYSIWCVYSMWSVSYGCYFGSTRLSDPPGWHRWCCLDPWDRGLPSLVSEGNEGSRWSNPHHGWVW